MTEAAVVYEVTMEVEIDIAAAFDHWLTDHVQTLLKLPGFQDARVLHGPDGASPAIRVVQYFLSDQAALDSYLQVHAARMRDDGLSRFGSRFKASRRTYPASRLERPAATPDTALRCLNCNTPLTGKYCVECGQPNHTVVAPLWETIEEFFGNHFGLDTRFFHSVIPLLIRPGFLTREYCAGRRERYIKPLRLYLFTSILFFFCAAWLAAKPVHSASATSGHPTNATVQKDLKPLSADEKPKLSGRLATGIARIEADPNAFATTLLYHTVPKAMFIFLPLVALLLKLLYIRRKHLYMEHLIFTLHSHAVFFLVLLPGVFVHALSRHYGWPAIVDTGTDKLISWYLLIYLLLALRNFYQQSWIKTAVKFCLMFVGYVTVAAFALAGAVMVTVMGA